MKSKALFHLNIINNDKANVYIILPKINIFYRYTISPRYELIFISQSKIKVTDPKLFYFKDYNFLDFIAFELQAESIYCSASLAV